MEPCFSPTEGIVVLPSCEPVPGVGVLPVQSFLLRAEAPILVDTGLAREQEAFIDALDALVDVASIRHILLTHEDADHAGALFTLLERAPHAELVTSLVGIGKLSSQSALPMSRVRVVEPGQEFEVGGRRMRALRPPMYDSPATLGFYELQEGWLFSSDGFGAFVPELTERTEDLPPEVALDGMAAFCCANSPWLADVEPSAYAAHLELWAATRPSWVFASHLAPLEGRAFGAFLERARKLPGDAAGLRALATGAPR